MFTQFTGIWNQGAAFHPTDLASNIGCWEATENVFDSGAAAASDGDEVYTWTETSQVGTPKDFIRNAADSGTFEITSFINSGDGIIFDGTNDYMILDGSDTSPLFSSTGNFHLFIVNAFTGGSASDAIFSQGNSDLTLGAINIAYRLSGGNTRATFTLNGDGTNSALSFFSQQALAGNTPHLLQLSRNGGTFSVTLDSTNNTGSTASGHLVEQDGFVIGAAARDYTANISAYGAFHIAAIYAFNSELSGTNLTNMTTYISNTWGV